MVDGLLCRCRYVVGCRLARCVVGRVNDDVCWMVLVVRAQRSTEVDEIIGNGDDGCVFYLSRVVRCCVLSLFGGNEVGINFTWRFLRYLFTFSIK